MRLLSGLAFQSTLPVRGATISLAFWAALKAISIHAPREGSDHLSDASFPGTEISIHAPREGSDQDSLQTQIGLFDISIHAPREGSDLFDGVLGQICAISIHAPREGSDGT